jgi:hypothetical protein
MKKIDEYIKTRFSKLNDKLLVSYDDSVILSLAKILDIDNELLSAQKKDDDFFTYQIVKNIYDVSGVYIFHFGKSNDSGFICFYAPNMVSNKTNILSFLNAVFIQNIYFDKEKILNTIIVSVLRELSSFQGCTPHVVRTPNQIWFEVEFKTTISN